jgi:hypothetical protein
MERAAPICSIIRAMRDMGREPPERAKRSGEFGYFERGYEHGSLVCERRLEHFYDGLAAVEVIDRREVAPLVISRKDLALGFCCVMKPVDGQHLARSPIERTDGAEANGPRIETPTRLTVRKSSHGAARPLRLVRDDLKGARDDLLLWGLCHMLKPLTEHRPPNSTLFYRRKQDARESS